MDNLSKSLAEAIETAILFLSKKSCWKVGFGDGGCSQYD